MTKARLAVTGVALALVAGLIVVVTTSFANAAPADNADVLAWCKAAQKGQMSDADRQWAKQCVRVLTMGKTRGGAPVPPVDPPQPPAPPPNPPQPQPPAPPQPPIQPGSGFPDANNTGVPAGTALTAYTGSCTITVPNTVIDAKTVNCDLSIRTTGVKITRSKINGTVADDGNSFSFTLTDSEVNAAPNGIRQATGVGPDNFTMLRTEVIGGNRGVLCEHNCTVQDSWIHGTKVLGDWHASAARASQGSKFIHNTLACDTQPTAQDGGCSANLTMYGDFEAVKDVLVQGNLFVANPTGDAFCAYGGSSPGKPFSTGASNIRFIGNTFQRGSNGKCGAFNPIDAFDTKAPGNQWSGNVWEGTNQPVNPS